ncbi:MAG TPA: glycosyltransferase [Burkholderiales bacterium]|jgi:N-acetylglucosaminyl-diphospho-decaprenol L-rhamnosyltransferase|nr:glycosyltransferase [Burkholderiales bacterium]
MIRPSVTVSVVSHGQNALLNRLLADLAEHCTSELELIVTQNILDAVPLSAPARVHRFEAITNSKPKGFGANHNAAFARSTSQSFFIVNPDVRLLGDPFQTLAGQLKGRVAAVGPVVLSASGKVEDSARRFPTLSSLLRKLFVGATGPDYPTDKGPIEVEWVAGMFIGFDREAFARVGGFDERYFLYYEDVDICRRLRNHGYKVLYDPTVSIVHEARRASRSDPRLMRIHAASVVRYLMSTLRSGS